jgi:hypothetical protein
MRRTVQQRGFAPLLPGLMGVSFGPPVSRIWRARLRSPWRRVSCALSGCGFASHMFLPHVADSMSGVRLPTSGVFY